MASSESDHKHPNPDTFQSHLIVTARHTLHDADAITSWRSHVCHSLLIVVQCRYMYHDDFQCIHNNVSVLRMQVRWFRLPLDVSPVF